MIRVVVEAELLASGQRKTQIFRHSPIFVGRGEDADFRIDLDAVSAIHGQIVASAGGCEYVDLSSRNGSCLDGKRLVEEVVVRLAAESTLILAGVMRLRVRSGIASKIGDELRPGSDRKDRCHDLGEEPTVHCMVRHRGDSAVADGAVYENAVSPRTMLVPVISSERTAILPALETNPPVIVDNDSDCIVMGSAGGTRMLPKFREVSSLRAENSGAGGGKEAAFPGVSRQARLSPVSIWSRFAALLRSVAMTLATILRGSHRRSLR